MNEQRTAWRNAALSGVVFALIMSLAIGVVGGVVAGALFAVIIGFFVTSRMVKQQTQIDLPPGETIEYSGLANHFLNFEGRGGRLYLTNKRLIFKPHAFNVQHAGVDIPRAEIAAAETTNIFGLIPTGLLVMPKHGAAQKFVVNGREEWARLLTSPAAAGA